MPAPIHDHLNNHPTEHGCSGSQKTLISCLRAGFVFSMRIFLVQFRFSPLLCTTVKQQTEEVLSLQPMFPPKPLDILPLEMDAQKVWTPLRKSGGIPYVSMRFSLSMEMSRLTRDGTAKPDQILRRGRGQGNIHFPFSVDHV